MPSFRNRGRQDSNGTMMLFGTSISSPMTNIEIANCWLPATPSTPGTSPCRIRISGTLCCLTGVGEDWDMAVVPSYNDTSTAALHADVFRILNTTEHPEEAFKVLAYLIGDAAPQLLEAYGAMPARKDLQTDFFAGLDEKYPQGVNWQVAVDSLAYPDVPSHEQDMPNFLKAQDRFGAFWSLLNTTPELDVEAEIDTLQGEMDTIFKENGELTIAGVKHPLVGGEPVQPKLGWFSQYPHCILSERKNNNDNCNRHRCSGGNPETQARPHGALPAQVGHDLHRPLDCRVFALDLTADGRFAGLLLF